MSNQDLQKEMVARAAVTQVLSSVVENEVIGVGTGSTANLFIDALAEHKSYFKAAVSSSEASTQRLLERGFTVLDSNEVQSLEIYVDGADEINAHGHMIKGGGGALTREKIVADLAKTFICICDASKYVKVLGHFPLPVEVIPMASAQVTRHLEALGGSVSLRQKKSGSGTFVSDNQGWILDVRGLEIHDPVEMETQINQMPGVISNGIFARRPANVLLLGRPDGVERITF